MDARARSRRHRIASGLLGRLHEHAERSGQEERTAQILAEFVEGHGLRVERGIGGHGLLVRIGERPRWLLRADMDALPAGDGARHACGHDGHMAMLAEALPKIADSDAAVVAFFQASEEDGTGMARSLQDPRLAKIEVDGAFGIHNLPGEPLGTVVIGPGALASTGVRLRFTGRESHAAHPERGASPFTAVVDTAQAVPHLSQHALDEDALATLVHMRLGDEAYGTSPGRGIVSATLRGSHDDVERMRKRLVALAQESAAAGGVRVAADEVDPFPQTANTDAGQEVARQAARAAGLDVRSVDAPFAWSEDFGHAVARWGGALVGLGAGTDHAPLHDDDYSFPEQLLDSGIRFWAAMAQADLPRPPAPGKAR